MYIKIFSSNFFIVLVVCFICFYLWVLQMFLFFSIYQRNYETQHDNDHDWERDVKLRPSSKEGYGECGLRVSRSLGQLDK